MTRPALLFDLYGVLLHMQSDRDIAAIEQAAGTDGRLWPVYWQLRPAFDAGQLSAEQYWRAVCDRLELDHVDIDRVISADTASWLRPDDEMIGAVRDLIDGGWTVGLLSNIPHFLADAVKAEFDFFTRFHAVTMSCDIGVAKPDPRAYTTATDALHSQPEHTIFFDDSPPNVDGARKAGLQAHVFTGKHVLDRVLDEL
ncbi:HAD family hydrolase [Corynebacterium mendelii]|uniref:HAD family phosphatase n=2 Tax=Corynebacterium mendelii TaxID=2765362 RepID=A0A939IU05_9CORY|nr:HAD family phosphatase [Corynebacterium mendelii]